MRYTSVTSAFITIQTIVLGVVGSFLATAATLAIQAMWGERIGRAGVTVIGATLVFTVVVPLAMRAAAAYRASVRAEVSAELMRQDGACTHFQQLR